MKKSLHGLGVYRGKKVEFAGVRGQVKELYGQVEKMSCGVVTENTKLVFRSESAKFFIYFQMSREMWEFDEDGDLFYEKALEGFLPELFSNWSLIGVNHLVSIVLFTRVNFEDLSPEDLSSHPAISVDNRFPFLLFFSFLLLFFFVFVSILIPHFSYPSQRTRGRYYQDFYKVVIDREIRTDWKTVLTMLKRFSLFFPSSLLPFSSPQTSLSFLLSSSFFFLSFP